MSNDDPNLLPEELEQQLIDLVQTVMPEGPEDDQFWSVLAQGPEPNSPTGRREETITLATQALAIARGELTLGRYLKGLRAEAKASWADVAREATLAPDLIRDVEADAWPITSVPAGRLARAAVFLGATKRVLLELIRLAPTTNPEAQQYQASLLRLDAKSSSDAGGASSIQPHGGAGTDVESYVAEVAAAFDVEQAKRTLTADP